MHVLMINHMVLLPDVAVKTKILAGGCGMFSSFFPSKDALSRRMKDRTDQLGREVRNVKCHS